MDPGHRTTGLGTGVARRGRLVRVHVRRLLLRPTGAGLHRRDARVDRGVLRHVGRALAATAGRVLPGPVHLGLHRFGGAGQPVGIRRPGRHRGNRRDRRAVGRGRAHDCPPHIGLDARDPAGSRCLWAAGRPGASGGRQPLRRRPGAGAHADPWASRPQARFRLTGRHAVRPGGRTGGPVRGRRGSRTHSAGAHRTVPRYRRRLFRRCHVVAGVVRAADCQPDLPGQLDHPAPGQRDGCRGSDAAVPRRPGPGDVLQRRQDLSSRLRTPREQTRGARVDRHDPLLHRSRDRPLGGPETRRRRRCRRTARPACGHVPGSGHPQPGGVVCPRGPQTLPAQLDRLVRRRAFRPASCAGTPSAIWSCSWSPPALPGGRRCPTAT